MNKEATRVIKNLKKGNTVQITTKDGVFEGVTITLTKVLMIVTLIKPMTSARAHSYHWDAGDPKSIMFKHILKIKRITYDDSTQAMAA